MADICHANAGLDVGSLPHTWNTYGTLGKIVLAPSTSLLPCSGNALAEHVQSLGAIGFIESANDVEGEFMLSTFSGNPRRRNRSALCLSISALSLG